MKECVKCGFVENYYNNAVDIYISSFVTHIIYKIEKALEKSGINFISKTDMIFVPNQKLKEVVQALTTYPEITSIEKQDILILPVPVNEQLTPQHAMQNKSLKAWEDIFDAEELLYIISSRKLLTFFHPIIDFKNKSIHAYECLTRGINQEGKIVPPNKLFSKAQNLYLQFNLDRLARETSIENAAKNKITNKKIFINFMPNSIYDPKECLASTFKKVQEYQINHENIVFEVIESDKITDVKYLKTILDIYKELGFGTALDDLGSGYSSLKMMVDLCPDYIKIDMCFIRDIHLDNFRQSIVKAMVQVSKENNIKVIAEGIETIDEFNVLIDLGVDYVQGFYFGQPNPSPPTKIDVI